MDRNEAIQAIVSVLEGMFAYKQVYLGAQRTMNGAGTIAVVYGRRLGWERSAHTLTDVPAELVVDVLMRCDPGQESAVELLFSDLVFATMQALHDALDAEDVTIEGSAPIGGAPLQAIDKIYYRAERITLRTADDFRG